ncbi:MAG: glycosyltransferase family 39 protein [Chloroflexus sp.]
MRYAAAQRVAPNYVGADTLEPVKQVDRLLWMLTLAGLMIRVAAVFALNDYRTPLTAEYGIVAQNLAAGKGFVGGGWLGPEQPTALNTPLYPLFLAFWLWLGIPLPFLAAELVQAVLSALIIYLIGKVVLELINPAIAVLSAGLTVIYPPLIYFCKQISPAILTAFFTILTLYVITRFFAQPTARRAIVVGVVWGLGLLAEPILLAAAPGAVLIFWWRQSTQERWRSAALLVIALALAGIVVLPWTVRNYQVFNRFVPLKTSFGLNFWMGNNPNATGFLYTMDGTPMPATLPPERIAYLASLNEAERYAVLQREALTWIAAHPDRFLALTVRRLGYLWLISPTYRITGENIVEPAFFYLFRSLIQVPLLILALIGVGLSYRYHRHALWLFLWWLFAFTLPYAISVAGNTRYRLPVEPILIVLAAMTCYAALARWRLVERLVPAR